MFTGQRYAQSPLTNTAFRSNLVQNESSSDSKSAIPFFSSIQLTSPLRQRPIHLHRHHCIGRSIDTPRRTYQHNGNGIQSNLPFYGNRSIDSHHFSPPQIPMIDNYTSQCGEEHKCRNTT